MNTHTHTRRPFLRKKIFRTTFQVHKANIEKYEKSSIRRSGLNLPESTCMTKNQTLDEFRQIKFDGQFNKWENKLFDSLRYLDMHTAQYSIFSLIEIVFRKIFNWTFRLWVPWLTVQISCGRTNPTNLFTRKSGQKRTLPGRKEYKSNSSRWK